MIQPIDGPFFKDRGEWLCQRCESHRNNEFWCCEFCADYKPKVAREAKNAITDKRYIDRRRKDNPPVPRYMVA